MEMFLVFHVLVTTPGTGSQDEDSPRRPCPQMGVGEKVVPFAPRVPENRRGPLGVSQEAARSARAAPARGPTQARPAPLATREGRAARGQHGQGRAPRSPSGRAAPPRPHPRRSGPRKRGSRAGADRGPPEQSGPRSNRLRRAAGRNAAGPLPARLTPRDPAPPCPDALRFRSRGGTRRRFRGPGLARPLYLVPPELRRLQPYVRHRWPRPPRRSSTRAPSWCARHLPARVPSECRPPNPPPSPNPVPTPPSTHNPVPPHHPDP
ncbi:vegetative cell wall protein gp1-like [Choloepus didactylus]|uniref:vegetative cell wall protein gp1-like n=1 Tax=Choloepus didactylus TaxID=27675 RepID=UPI00189CF422|nr:vegetative cell wall protein gp1-like [Choloepus didactylus]